MLLLHLNHTRFYFKFFFKLNLFLDLSSFLGQIFGMPTYFYWLLVGTWKSLSSSNRRGSLCLCLDSYKSREIWYFYFLLKFSHFLLKVGLARKFVLLAILLEEIWLYLFHWSLLNWALRDFLMDLFQFILLFYFRFLIFLIITFFVLFFYFY